MKPKYQIGDEVWIIGSGKIEKKVISAAAIITDHDTKKQLGVFYCLYTFTTNTRLYSESFTAEKDIFPTKEALIASL